MKENTRPYSGLSKGQKIQHYVERIRWASRMIRRLGVESPVGVEVGLWKADFAINMLKENPTLRWYGIDPYTPYGRKSRKQPAWDDIYNRVVGKMEKYIDERRFFLIRKYASEGHKFIPDNVDFVFIDGNHDCEFVYKDIILYEKKLRKGGIIGGHDYYGEGVSRAVDDYANLFKRNLKWSFDFDPAGIWWWKL